MKKVKNVSVSNFIFLKCLKQFHFFGNHPFISPNQKKLNLNNIINYIILYIRFFWK